jgi:hypothetical protein
MVQRKNYKLISKKNNRIDDTILPSTVMKYLVDKFLAQLGVLQVSSRTIPN